MTGNYRIQEFYPLNSILKAVYIFRSRPVLFWSERAQKSQKSSLGKIKSKQDE